MHRKIFEQQQIARAVELGLGVSTPSEIDIFPADQESRQYSEQVAAMLMAS